MPDGRKILAEIDSLVYGFLAGLICSEGTSVEISWGVADSKLWMKDLNGNEISLNPGKTYIGYGSSNHSGAYSVITDTQN